MRKNRKMSEMIQSRDIVLTARGLFFADLCKIGNINIPDKYFWQKKNSRRPSVSFTAMPPGVLVNDSRSNSTDDIQIALAPHIQTYLSQTGRRHSCCSVMLPVAFERASSKSWMDPKFDSPVLEGQFQTSVFPHVRMRYRFALSYILIRSLSWFLYTLIDGG